ncbi:hypothetical protein GQ457_09G006700 [Hibiscus cannabinus]
MSPKPGLRPFKWERELTFREVFTSVLREVYPPGSKSLVLAGPEDGLDSKRISITVILGHPGLLNQYRLLTRNKAGEMDDRLANIEKAFEDIKSDIEKKMERAQQSTQDYIAQSHADFLAKVAEMLTGNDPKKGKRLVIDPSALQKTEGPSDKTHLVASSSIEKQQSPQFGSSSFQRFDIQNNPGEYTVANEASKVETEMYKRLEDLDHRLEEKFKAAEGPDARELSLVPNLVLPMKFKMPEFEKFDGTSSPAVHLTMFCRRMTGHVDNDELLIHCFQDSLKGSAARWYNQLTRDKIRSWKDLAKAFIEQYKHITDIEPDRITLQNMEMKPNESFRQYVQRWRDVAAHVQPPLLEKEITPTFVRTLKEPFLNYMSYHIVESVVDQFLFRSSLSVSGMVDQTLLFFRSRLTVKVCHGNIKSIKGCSEGRHSGKPFPGVQVRIAEDKNGGGTTGEGELCVKSPSLFKEYWKLPQVTKESFTDDGFFKTGDACRVDEDGYYVILGRTSADIMKVGGYKLSALEIESVLLQHPDIAECCVFGLPDKDYGEAVSAIVVLDSEQKRKLEESNSAFSLEYLCNWAKDKLAPYKLPTRLMVWDSLPRNAMGKVNKKELKRQLGNEK